MVKIAPERNTCEEKALLSSIACDLFVLICQRNYANRRVSRISQISLSANVLIGCLSCQEQLLRDASYPVRMMLLLPQFVFSAAFPVLVRRPGCQAGSCWPRKAAAAKRALRWFRTQSDRSRCLAAAFGSLVTRGIAYPRLWSACV